MALATTRYFQAMRERSDRRAILDDWIEQVIAHPWRQQTQPDGRIRRWACIDAAEGRYLRVVLLPDGQTVHNAFFDRRFVP
jgi:hypothetical protein